MRDICGDLQDRANLIEKQITETNNDFEKSVEQLQHKLKAVLAVLVLLEDYRLFLMELLRSNHTCSHQGAEPT